MKLFFIDNWVKALLGCFFIVTISNLSAQVTVSLSELEGTTEHSSCYSVNLENTGDQSIHLAGQNYRLYYDSDALLLKEGSIKSYLPDSYEHLKLVQHFFDADASGFGVLSYESNLGFINLATDYKLESGAAVILNKNEPMKVAEMCFQKKDGKIPTFTWALDGLTHTYATAFVEMSLLDGKQLIPAKLTGYKVKTGQGTQVQKANVLDVSFFPNPFTETFNITFNETLKSDATMKIKNVWGELVYSQKVGKGAENVVLHGSDFATGALIIELQDSDGNTSVIKAIRIK